MLIPLPFVTALICAVFGLRVAGLAALPRGARLFFAGFATVAALESLLVGIRFGYGIEAAIPVQRVLPLLLGPMIYLGFEALRTENIASRARLHLGIAALAIAAMYALPVLFDAATATTFMLPMLLDIAITVSYAAYLVLLVAIHRQGVDALARLNIETMQRMRNWLVGAIALLGFIFIMDTAIAAAFAFGAGDDAARLIAVGSVPVIAALIAALLNAPSGRRAARIEGDEALMREIDTFLGQSRLYRDPELTLARLARRMGRPARDVSRAINAATGANVSHYINDRRIGDAAGMLVSSDSTVEEIARDCGFMSRSNFYREFQRVHATSPSAYRKQTAGGRVTGSIAR
jgi:AraC-like DNA-binding protein